MALHDHRERDGRRAAEAEEKTKAQPARRWRERRRRRCGRRSHRQVWSDASCTRARRPRARMHARRRRVGKSPCGWPHPVRPRLSLAVCVWAIGRGQQAMLALAHGRRLVLQPARATATRHADPSTQWRHGCCSQLVGDVCLATGSGAATETDGSRNSNLHGPRADSQRTVKAVAQQRRSSGCSTCAHAQLHGRRLLVSDARSQPDCATAHPRGAARATATRHPRWIALRPFAPRGRALIAAGPLRSPSSS